MSFREQLARQQGETSRQDDDQEFESRENRLDRESRERIAEVRARDGGGGASGPLSNGDDLETAAFKIQNLPEAEAKALFDSLTPEEQQRLEQFLLGQ